ncbi:MAG: hypothetical protein OEZ06_28500 [Myxococcales bacterium]|nr:hypothetical protein [Myxococcales bacterium]
MDYPAASSDLPSPRPRRLGPALIAACLTLTACGGASQAGVKPSSTDKPSFEAATDHPMCVVLSVGAQHGVAHLGALRAIVQNPRLPIACVAGASMGSLAASVLASAPAEDPVVRYGALMERYRRDTAVEAGGRATLGAIAGFVLLGPLGAAAGAAGGVGSVDRVNWERFVASMDDFYRGAQIEGLPLSYINFHQRIDKLGPQPVTVADGNLAQAVGASIANPLIFDELEARDIERLDPGMDSLLRVPIEATCAHFPRSRILAINVTRQAAVYRSEIPCPVWEISIPPIEAPTDAMDPESDAFSKLVEHGERVTRQALERAGIPPA